MRKELFLSVAALIASGSLAVAQQGPSATPDGSKGPAPSQNMGSPTTPGKPSGQEPGAGKNDKGPTQMKDEDRSASDNDSGPLKKNQKDAADDGALGQMKKDGKTGDASGTTEMDRSGDSDSKADRDDKKRDGRAGDNDDKRDSKQDAGATAGNSKGQFKSVTGDRRSKVTTTFSRHLVEPERNLNIEINVGVAVPRDVRFYAIPQDIIVVVPEYRDYRYFIVGNQLCIVDPDSYEIVDIILIA